MNPRLLDLRSSRPAALFTIQLVRPTPLLPGDALHAATSRTTAMVFGSEVNARTTSEHPITMSIRNGIPSSGWSPSTSGSGDVADERCCSGDPREREVEHHVHEAGRRVDLAEATARTDWCTRAQHDEHEAGEHEVAERDRARDSTGPPTSSATVARIASPAPPNRTTRRAGRTRGSGCRPRAEGLRGVAWSDRLGGAAHSEQHGRDRERPGEDAHGVLSPESGIVVVGAGSSSGRPWWAHPWWVRRWWAARSWSNPSSARPWRRAGRW